MDIVDKSKDLAIENLTKKLMELEAKMQSQPSVVAQPQHQLTADEIVKKTFEDDEARKKLELKMYKNAENKLKVEQYLKEFNDPTLNSAIDNLKKGDIDVTEQLDEINKYALEKLKEKYDSVPTIKASLSVIKDYETAKIMIRNLESTITTPKTDVKVESPMVKKFNNSKNSWHSAKK
jgi:hypothetical protein